MMNLIVHQMEIVAKIKLQENDNNTINPIFRDR